MCQAFLHTIHYQYHHFVRWLSWQTNALSSASCLDNLWTLYIDVQVIKFPIS